MSVKPEDFLKLENNMKEYADKSVDLNILGRPERTSETGEPYVTYSFFFHGEDDCMILWRETIDGLIASKKHEKHEGSCINNSPKLYIYWRTYPEVTFYKEKNVHIFRARLLITSKDIAMGGGV